MTKPVLESPCIKVCAVEGRTGYCIGCGRSLKEIGGWSQFSAEERTTIMEALPARMTTANPSEKLDTGT